MGRRDTEVAVTRPSRLIGASLLAAFVALAPANASQEQEAAAAMDRMLASEGAVLDTLELIEDEATLERHRAALSERLGRARIERDALAEHADTFAEAPALRAVIRAQLLAYNVRRRAVHAAIVDRLDEETLDRLDDVFDAAD
jgi:hypothetical protein